MMDSQRPKLPPPQPRPAGASLALEGLRVIDFTRMLSGPYSTQQLADFGAEIIKVEAPDGGDDSRNYTTTSLAGECAFFLSTNRNRKSITLDLKTEAGRFVTDVFGPDAILRKLAIRLGATAYPGDTLVIAGNVVRKSESAAGCEIVVSARGTVSRGDHVTGEVTLTLPAATRPKARDAGDE